ncbi:methyltransferase domain-containing protein [Rossellomorea vietnamensis]|uniref:Methyltransferase domain-containing protein n=1 Tax=Rossellomorea vietnamensis TaxID=218284 RepID=A0A5D4MHM8_9BACI|nr:MULTISPECIES: methyltransferase domain-containing protein [Bacillaceae]TYS00824.1 methyltransferase domain-containing protein [Rossellomorea vietnamensis]
MSYQQFAYIYDYLMKDVPYDSWVEFVQAKADKYAVSGRELLDLGCGTGELSLRLLKEGYSVTGIDLSEDMLFMAREKAENDGLQLPLYQQDMSELQGLGSFDIISIFCDSLNYLETEEKVISTFKNVRDHLRDDGLFLFDVHSIFKLTQIFLNETFTYNDEEVSYIWDCFPGEKPNSVDHELTFFVRDGETGQYERVEELHHQRTFPILTLETWLQETGFEVMDITADFSDIQPGDHSERIFFTCKKK